jgi:outer membrane protein assembly factor BamB
MFTRRKYLTSFALPSGLASTTPAYARSASDWPTSQRDPGHTGVSAGQQPQPPLGVAWSTTYQDRVTAPVVSDGRIYVGSHDNHLYALDAGGGRLWSFETGDEIASAPSVWGETVYVSSKDGSVYGLDAASGERQWEYETGADVTASPLVSDGKILVGNYDGSFVALDAEGGAELWTHDIPEPIYHVAAYADGTAFVVDDTPALTAIDAVSGERQWRFEEYAGETYSVSVRDGRVYYVNWGRTYVLDRETGDVIDTISGETAGYVGSPAIGTDRLYLACGDGNHICAISTVTGEKRWERRLARSTGVFSPPALVGDTLYVGSGIGTFYALDSATGEVLWHMDTGDPIMTGIAVAGDRIVFSTEAGTVYSLTSDQGWNWPVVFGGGVLGAAAMGYAALRRYNGQSEE